MDDAPLTERQSALIERAARRIVQLDLVVPAILALEGLQPLSRVSGQLLHLLSPSLGLLLPGEDWRALAELMEEREGIERLLRRIEEMDRESPERTGAG